MVKKILLSLMVGLLTFCLIQFISTQTTLFTSMENSLLNGFYYMREPGVNKHNRLVSNRVMLLGYDEKSLAAIGKWPWKRYVHAGFLDKIEQFCPSILPLMKMRTVLWMRHGWIQLRCGSSRRICS